MRKECAHDAYGRGGNGRNGGNGGKQKPRPDGGDRPGRHEEAG
ncbi:hypothetical protein GCM10018987_66400 [Streptomyces cremeus]